MSQNAYPHAIQTVNFYGEQIQINAEFGLICCSPILLQKINHTLVSFTQAVGRENLRYLPGFSKQRPFIAAKILHDFLESAANEGADVEIFDVYDKTLEAMAEFHLVRSESQATPENTTPKVDLLKTDVALSSKQPTMSSLEIADLVGKRHDHVMRDICNMIEQLEKAKKDSPNLGCPSKSGNSILSWYCESGTYINKQNKSQPCYLLDYNTTVNLLTGYDAAKRMMVIQRWQELEATKAQAPKVQQKPESKIKHMINAAAMRVAHMMIEGMKISPERKTLARAEILHQQFGIPLESLLPDTDPMLSATAIADKLGVSSNMIGRLVTRLKIRDNPALAQARLSKSAHSSKEVEQWFYDPKVVDIIRQHIGEQDTRGVDELALA